MTTTQEQNSIISWNPHVNLCICACPGAGKTTTIILKIKWMHEQCKIPLAQIALFTYNKYLAMDMILKLESVSLNAKNLGWCGTIHAFCYKWTKNHSDLQPFISCFKELDRDPCSTIKYVIFDEYQDADEQIAESIKIIAKNKWLTICGDERQQIYGYKGADSALMLNLRDDWTKKTLSSSFRCTKQICSLLTKLYPSYPQIKSNKDGPLPVFYRKKSNMVIDTDIIEKIVQIVSKVEGTIAIISPIVHSETISKFMNDIHSNVEKRTKKKFICHLGEFKDNISINPQITNIITSIHGVKGREYDTVILLNACDDENLFNYPTSDSLAKLFVALSRAKQNLWVIENLWHPNFGSIPWLVDLEKNFCSEGNLIKPFRRKEKDKNKDRSFLVQNWVKSIDPKIKNELMSKYDGPYHITGETGLNLKKETFGLLIRWLFYLKIGQVKPHIKKEVLITIEEWKNFLAGHSKSICDKIKRLDPDSTIRLNKKSLVWSGGKITEKNIVSHLVEQEYYKNLDKAIQLEQDLPFNLAKKEILDLWWLSKFQRLSKLSVVGFFGRNLKDEEVDNILSYLDKTLLLDRFKILETKKLIEGNLFGTNLSGEISFVGEDFLLEIGSVNHNDLLVQTCLINELGPNKKDLYIFDPFEGNLYQTIKIV